MDADFYFLSAQISVYLRPIQPVVCTFLIFDQYMRNLPTFLPKHKYLPLLLIVSPFVLFWRWVIHGEVLFWGTLILQFWPWHQLTQVSLLDGQWPLWNPLLGNGTPLLANQQSAVFYPPNLLYLIIPVEHGLTLSIVLHLLLAGLLMYAYARHVSLSPFAATVAALSYMFSGYLVGRTQFVDMVNAAAWLPLLLLLADRLVIRPRQNAVWLALVLALQLLAGHSQLWFYSLILVSAYTLFRSRQQYRFGPAAVKKILESIVLLAVAVALALLLSAAQLLPTAEFVTESPRSTGAERDEALAYSFWPWRLITLTMPDFFGTPAQGNYWGYATYWEDHTYQGILPLILALTAIGLLFKRKQSTDADGNRAAQVAPFFAVVIPVSLILAMGWNTPVYLFLFDYVPGFGLFRGPARLLIWLTVAVSILAGVGADQFKLTPSSRRNWQRLMVAAIALTLAGFAGTFVLSGRSLTFLTAVQKTGFLLSAAVVILLFQPRLTGTARRTRWEWMVVIFVTVDLLTAALPLIPTLPASLFTRPIAGADYIKQNGPGFNRVLIDPNFAHQTIFEQYFLFEDFGPMDVDHWQLFKETLVPNLSVYANLPTANNNDPLTVSRWQELMDILLQSDEPAHHRRISMVMGATHRVTGVDDPISTGPVIYTSGQMVIQPVSEALPRAYFVPQARFVINSAAAQELLLSNDFDPRREVVLLGDDDDISPSIVTGSTLFSAVEVLEQGAQTVLLNVTAKQPGWVVLTDTYYPGWQATINGQPAPIWQANIAFRAVQINQAGKHQIVFRYQPRSLTFGLWTTAVTGLILIAMAFVVAGAHRKSQTKRKLP